MYIFYFALESAVGAIQWTWYHSEEYSRNTASVTHFITALLSWIFHFSIIRLAIIPGRTSAIRLPTRRKHRKFGFQAAQTVSQTYVISMINPPRCKTSVHGEVSQFWSGSHNHTQGKPIRSRFMVEGIKCHSKISFKYGGRGGSERCFSQWPNH